MVNIISIISSVLSRIPVSVRFGVYGLVAGIILGVAGYWRFVPPRVVVMDPLVITETKTEIQERVRTVTREVEKRPDGTVIERETEKEEDKKIAESEKKSVTNPPVTKIVKAKNSVEVRTYVAPSRLDEYNPYRDIEVSYGRRLWNSDFSLVVGARPLGSAPEVTVGVRLDF